MLSLPEKDCLSVLVYTFSFYIQKHPVVVDPKTGDVLVPVDIQNQEAVMNQQGVKAGPVFAQPPMTMGAPGPRGPQGPPGAPVRYFVACCSCSVLELRILWCPRYM